MDAAFGLQPAIGVAADDLDRRRFQPRFLAGAFLQPFDLVPVRLGPARIHAQQHLGPVLGLGAAGPGVDFQVTVVGVGLARQQGLQFRPGGPRLELLQGALGLAGDIGVVLGLGHFQEFQVIGELAFEGIDLVQARFQVRALAHHRLGVFGIVPQVGVFGPGVQVVEAVLRGVVVKGASSAVPATALFPR